MKTYTFKKAALSAAICFSFNMAAESSQGVPAKSPQRVTIVVDGNGYKPASVNVKAGQPVQLTFVSKGDSCSNTVNFPALKKSLSLNRGDQKTLTYTPKKGQTLSYICGMQMFKGKVVAR